LGAHDQLKHGGVRGPLTTTEYKSSDADAGNTPTEDIQTSPVKRPIRVIPQESGANLDGVGRFIDFNFVKTLHGDLHSRRRRETRVGRVATALDRKWSARVAEDT